MTLPTTGTGVSISTAHISKEVFQIAMDCHSKLMDDCRDLRKWKGKRVRVKNIALTTNLPEKAMRYYGTVESVSDQFVMVRMDAGYLECFTPVEVITSPGRIVLV